MYTGLLHTHSSLRYLVLLFLLIVIVKSIIGWTGKKPFAKIDNTFSLVLLIVTHLQLVAGLVLYFVSPRVSLGEGMMTDIYRYFTVEHVAAMILAVGLITGARSASKKAVDDERKFKILAIFNLIALAIILITLVLGKLNVFGPGSAV
jgi:hypothetical protein